MTGRLPREPKKWRSAAIRSEAGRFIGMRAAGRGGDDVSTLEGAILGLLAPMIGFTFAMTLSRFEARRDAVLA